MKPLTLLTFTMVFLSLALVSFAQDDSFSYSTSYKGVVNFSLAASYSAGQTITTNVTVTNDEAFPIADAYLIFNVVQGCSTPADFSRVNITDCDAIIAEQKIPLSLAAFETKNVTLSYAVPSDAKTGTYRIDAYLQTLRTPITGQAMRYLIPIYKSFTVTGAGDFPSARFTYSKTQLGGIQGPTEVVIRDSAEGLAYIKADKAFSGTLNVNVCWYDDVSCPTFIVNKSYPVSLNAGEEKPIAISFAAPSKPGPYAVRLELKDSAGRLTALHRSFFYVGGEFTIPFKVAIDKPFYDAGASGNIKILLSASPVPPALTPNISMIIKNSALTATIKDLTTNKTAFTQKVVVPQITSDGDIFYEFNFTTQTKLSKFEVCGQTDSSAGALFDKYCYTVDSKNFAGAKHNFKVVPSYDAATSKLTAKICVANEFSIPTSARVDIELLTREPFNIIGNKTGVSIVDCSDVAFSIPQGSYTLVIRDLDLKDHYEFSVVAAPATAKLPAIPSTYIIIAIALVVVIVAAAAISRKRGQKVIKPPTEI